MTLVPMGPLTWQEARRVVARGGVVAFPTDTVYGVGCDPRNVSAIRRIYELKGRDTAKALPLLLCGMAALRRVTSVLPPVAQSLGGSLWPGGLTLVVPRHPSLPPELGGGDTIAVRVPDHDDLREFIMGYGGAIAATSANLSGQPDALDAAAVEAYFGDRVDLIIDGGSVPGGVPSTVVNCLTDPPAILRQGPVPEGEITRVLELERQF